MAYTTCCHVYQIPFRISIQLIRHTTQPSTTLLLSPPIYLQPRRGRRDGARRKVNQPGSFSFDVLLLPTTHQLRLFRGTDATLQEPTDYIIAKGKKTLEHAKHPPSAGAGTLPSSFGSPVGSGLEPGIEGEIRGGFLLRCMLRLLFGC